MWIRKAKEIFFSIRPVYINRTSFIVFGLLCQLIISLLPSEAFLASFYFGIILARITFYRIEDMLPEQHRGMFTILLLFLFPIILVTLFNNPLLTTPIIIAYYLALAILKFK